MKPTIKQFIDAELSNGVVSDEQMVNRYVSRYMRSSIIRMQWCEIAKKGESIRKLLSTMRKRGKIKVSERIERQTRRCPDWFVSCEIFYKK